MHMIVYDCMFKISWLVLWFDRAAGDGQVKRAHIELVAKFQRNSYHCTIHSPAKTHPRIFKNWH